MAIPASGAISLTTIQTEFGGSNPIGLNEYYAGGAYVPAGTTGTYGAVPSSGAISLRNFYGTSKPVVNFNDVTVYAVNSGAGASAGYRVNDDGFDYSGINGTFTSNQQWVTPTSVGGNYEVNASVTSGLTPTGTIGSWVATTTDPTWTITRATVGINTSVLSIQVRAVGTTTVLDTWSVTLEAERDV